MKNTLNLCFEKGKIPISSDEVSYYRGIISSSDRKSNIVALTVALVVLLVGGAMFYANSASQGVILMGVTIFSMPFFGMLAGIIAENHFDNSSVSVLWDKDVINIVDLREALNPISDYDFVKLEGLCESNVHIKQYVSQLAALKRYPMKGELLMLENYSVKYPELHAKSVLGFS